MEGAITLHEAQEEKRIAERKIFEAIREFQTKTDLSVFDINIRRTKPAYGPDITLAVELDIRF